MPNWKKVITSGSDATLNTLTVTNGITGSLEGTASYALTASYTPAISGTDNYIPKFKGTSTLENSLIYDNGTNVGIGTTSPNYKFEIIHSSAGDIARFRTDGGLSSIVLGGISNSSYIKTGPADSLRLSINDLDNPDLFIDSPSGYVGIGTSTPSHPLTVVGSISSSGDIYLNNTLLSNKENTDVDTGTETVATVAIATYTAAFFDFVVKNGTNVRSGTVLACHDGTNVEFTETSTADLGNTADVTLSVDISGANMRLLATATTNNWSVKTLVRAL